MDVVVGLQDADFVIGEFDTVEAMKGLIRGFLESQGDYIPYVKPLIRVNSCLMLPPSAFALSLALVSSSGEAFSFRVTWDVMVSRDDILTRRERHTL
jgi:hypothetical protein